MPAAMSMRVMDATKIDAAFYNELKKHYSEPQIMDLGGEIISTKQGPIEHPGLRHELQARAFVVRTLHNGLASTLRR